MEKNRDAPIAVVGSDESRLLDFLRGHPVQCDSEGSGFGPIILRGILEGPISAAVKD
jgi:hypothetical protein